MQRGHASSQPAATLRTVVLLALRSSAAFPGPRHRRGRLLCRRRQCRRLAPAGRRRRQAAKAVCTLRPPCHLLSIQAGRGAAAAPHAPRRRWRPPCCCPGGGAKLGHASQCGRLGRSQGRRIHLQRSQAGMALEHGHRQPQPKTPQAGMVGWAPAQHRRTSSLSSSAPTKGPAAGFLRCADPKANLTPPPVSAAAGMELPAAGCCAPCPKVNCVGLGCCAGCWPNPKPPPPTGCTGEVAADCCTPKPKPAVGGGAAACCGCPKANPLLGGCCCCCAGWPKPGAAATVCCCAAAPKPKPATDGWGGGKPGCPNVGAGCCSGAAPKPKPPVAGCGAVAAWPKPPGAGCCGACAWAKPPGAGCCCANAEKLGAAGAAAGAPPPPKPKPEGWPKAGLPPCWPGHMRALLQSPQGLPGCRNQERQERGSGGAFRMAAYDEDARYECDGRPPQRIGPCGELRAAPAARQGTGVAAGLGAAQRAAGQPPIATQTPQPPHSPARKN